MRRLLCAAACSAALTGCVYADAGIATFPVSSEPVLAPLVDDVSPSPTEIAYARDTVRVLFRQRDGERTLRFVSADPNEGYALCLRSAGDHALLVFQRRIFEAAIPQAADDAAILRSAADTAPCRSRRDWTPV